MAMAIIDRSDPEGPLLSVTASLPTWRPRDQADLAPSGAKAKAKANLAALTLLRHLQATGAVATPADATVLARWAGWGALPNIFDEADTSWGTQRAELRALLDDEVEWAAARRTTINAHYTSAEVVSAMWDALTGLGFTGGRVLEPGCGSGNFIGLAPELPLDVVGVELDPVTAAIAGALYPAADIRAQGFEDVTFTPDTFDLVVGNVPFAKLALNDPLYNKARHSVHNHFILKSLAFLRPGGLMAVLTSRYSLDSRNSAARREMAERADLIGALRLPEGAFQAAAGTSAVIDMLILRKRTNGASLFATPWTSLATMPAAGDIGHAEINEYFAAHPDHLLGTLATARGMYGKDEPTVLPDGDLAPRLATALSGIVAHGLSTDLAWLPPVRALTVARRKPAPPATTQRAAKGTGAGMSGATVARVGTVVLPPPPRKEGTILSHEGAFGIVRHGVIETFHPAPKNDTEELRQLVHLRDIVAALLEAQATSADDAKFTGYQALLGLAYDTYVARFGPLNRFSLRPTGRLAHECGGCGHQWVLGSKAAAPTRCPGCREAYVGDGDPKTARIRPRMGGFRIADPDLAALLALEIFDPDTQTAERAPIFTKRVVSPREHRTSATTAQDALSICLDTHGDVRLDVIAQLLDVTTQEARIQLGTLVWDEPVTARLETSAKYLSGNVRIKLSEARLAAVGEPRYLANVEALEAVLPADLGPTEIDARLGCTWISTDIVKDFIHEALMDLKTPALKRNHPVEVGHVRLTASWSVSVRRWEQSSVAMSSTWGTGRCPASTLVQYSLNQAPAVVYDKTFDGKQVKNPEATLAALEKQELIAERFSTWVWEDHDRANALVRIYNDRFNSTVAPNYDGSHLSLPGMSTHLTPHPHQRNSIWRAICEPTVGLFQPVGSGKTLILAGSVMEMRRLGLVRKPMIVVPNHMLEQFAGEFLQHYPLARVLIATKEQTTAEHRREFIARCAMGDWDAIIITTSSFERIPVSPGTRAKFITTKIAELTDAIIEQQSMEDSKLSIKRMELAKAKLEERHERLLAEHRKDEGINFETAGIDHVSYDEAHYCKNLAFPTRIRSAGGAGSQRAEDLEVKLWYLRATFGERVVILSTATPVANSLAEVFVMQRYLQPEALRAAQIHAFDAWAATFGRIVNAVELAPDGSSYRIGSRFARFANVPDLMAMFRLVADVRTPEELDLPGIPELRGAAPEVVVVPTTPALAAYMVTLAARAEAVRKRMVEPEDDNMLKVSGDGRNAALHLRLVTDEDGVPLAPDGTHKVLVAAAEIASIYHAHKHDRYRDPAGNVALRPGACQIVFSDLGTPHEGRWSVYAELRDELHRLGIPQGMVRFIHDAKDDRSKAELFQACRDGRVAVLLASTAKGGVGTNIQTRLIAEHHIDCPWRPCDIEQREGRILRQGNQNATVRILRFVTERSFDTYLWQTVARKAAFIYQVMSGKFKGREVDDIGEQSLTFAEVKALATGNPLLMEQAGVDQAVAKLVRSERAHDNDQWRLKRAAEDAKVFMASKEQEAEMCDAAIATRTETKGDAFTMRVGIAGFDNRKAAGEALLLRLQQGIGRADDKGYTERIAQLGGQNLTANWRRKMLYGDYYGRTTVEIIVRVEGAPIAYQMSREDIATTDAQGLVLRFEHGLQKLELTRDQALAKAAGFRTEHEAALARIGLPFPQKAELVALEARAMVIAATLKAMAMAEDAKRDALPEAPAA